MRILLFLLIPLLAFANSNHPFAENEDPTVFHHVHVITGNLNISFQDTLVQGAEPIEISRTYSSSGALERNPRNFDQVLKALRNGWFIQGGWSLLPHTNLLIETSLDNKKFKAYLREPNGNMIPYTYSKQRSKYRILLKPETTTARASGKLSSRNNMDYSELQLDVKKGIATLFLPDGGERTYQGASFYPYDNNSLGKVFYLLHTEKLPHGRHVRYFYEEKTTHLKRVESTNPAQNKVYAALDIDYVKPEKHKPFELLFKTSDGKALHYKTWRHEKRDYLCELQSPCRPHQKFSLHPGRKGIGARVTSLDLGGKEPFSVQYYLPANINQERKWAEKPEQKEFQIDKVEKILAPVGPNGEKIAVATFYYYPNQTDVKDAEGLLIRYHHDANCLLKIEYFDEKDHLCSYQKFFWDGSQMCCKAMFDKNHQPLFAKTFRYDEGNVVEEVLWGSLTGLETAPLQIDSHGQCSGAESYRKTYSYYKDQYNLLKTEHEEDGPSYEYFYKLGTDLRTAKLTKDQEGKTLIREFFFYDEDHLLIHEIIDDGYGEDPNDVSGVTERLEKRYEPNSITGLTESVMEYYYDPSSRTCKLLKKTNYTYLNQKVHREDIFDAEGNFRFSIFTDYDEFGQVKRRTTPSGKENTYRYNRLGYLEESKEVGSSRTVFTYDQANRATFCEEPDTGKVGITTYDPKGRILSQTDFRGNKTVHTYDCFGNRRTTELPESIDENGEKYKPLLRFDYDIHGNLAAAIDPLQGKTENRYNLFRKPIVTIQADGTQIRHFYHKNGTLSKTVYAEGTEVHYEYDLFQRQTRKTVYGTEQNPLLVEKWDYNSFQLISHTDVRGLETKFIYDGAGRKIGEEAEDRKVTFTYDSLGFLEKTDNGVVALIQKHNLDGLIEEQWEEDSIGRIENWMKFFYNSENQKEKALRNTSQGESVDLFSYIDGKLSSNTDPNHHTTTFLRNEFFKNELGQHVLQKTTIDPIGLATIETYDAGERITVREKKDLQGATVFKESFFYDRSGNQARRTSYIYADGTQTKEISTTWKYDPMGRIKEETESNQKTTFYDYDVRGRLEYKTLPDKVSLHYTYDGADRLEELRSSDGKIHYQYFYEIGPDPSQILDLVQGINLTRRYNLFGQVTKETNSRGSISTWEYDSIGRCTLFTLPDRSSIAYPTRGIHISAVQRKDRRGETLYEHTYNEFDSNGHIIEENRIFQLGSIQTTHDLLERPERQSSLQMHHSISYGPSGLVTETYNSLFGTKHFKYDPLNQLKEEGDQVYDFDSLGNPTEYEVNDLNQISATPECTLTYDDNGNPKNRSLVDQSIEYQFDPLGRLVEITTTEKRKVIYSYDPLSRLFAKEIYTYTGNSWKQEKKVFYLYDREQEIGTQDERGYSLDLKILGLGIRGDIGAAVALEIGGSVYATLHDFHGNIVALISSQGNLVETYEITAFGKEKSNPSLSPWRFSSKRSEEGLFFFGLRFYDPTLGRWLNPDPAGFTEGANLYLFVQNSPLNRLDLFGLISEDPFNHVQINAPIINIPRLPGFNAFFAKGLINGIEVDFVLCCGHWHQLRFTQEELNLQQVNILDHLQELIPTSGRCVGLLSLGNGIYTSKQEYFQMCTEVGKKAGGTLLMGLYNPTGLGRYGLGCGIDLERTRMEREGIETSIVCLNRQFYAFVGEKMYNINPLSLWATYLHSENGLITKRAIEGITDKEKGILRDILHIFALGPAEALPKNHGASVINAYSEKDYVTGFGPLGRVKSYINNPDYEIQVLPCLSATHDKNLWIADHGFLKPTYRKAWQGHINNLKEKFTFYQGSGNDQSR